MGTWGPGLYANDLARDLKSTIASVIRLPLEHSELVSLLKDSFPGQSSQEDDEEYTSFWLVVADQFHKLGVSDPDVFERAIGIVDSGMDLNCPERKELSALDRRKREKVLAELRERLTKPPPNKARKTLRKPQPLLMNAGDLVIFPVFAHNNCVNPYSSRWTQQQECWGAACIVRSGHVFQYLAYYYPVVLASRFDLSQKPSPAELLASGKWELRRPGTCSKVHFGRMQLEIIDHLTLDQKQLVSHFPEMRDGRYQVINDISISNSFSGSMGVDATLDRLEDIVE